MIHMNFRNDVLFYYIPQLRLAVVSYPLVMNLLIVLQACVLVTTS